MANDNGHHIISASQDQPWVIFRSVLKQELFAGVQHRKCEKGLAVKERDRLIHKVKANCFFQNRFGIAAMQAQVLSHQNPHHSPAFLLLAL